MRHAGNAKAGNNMALGWSASDGSRKIVYINLTQFANCILYDFNV